MPSPSHGIPLKALEGRGTTGLWLGTARAAATWTCLALGIWGCEFFFLEVGVAPKNGHDLGRVMFFLLPHIILSQGMICQLFDVSFGSVTSKVYQSMHPCP